MRSLMFTAFFLAMTLPACAGNGDAPGSPETSGQTAATQTTVISGYSIPTPQRIDQPIEWDAVKGHLPARLYETPETPKKPAEIYNEVNNLMQAKMREYDEALDKLTSEKQGDYPDQSFEDVRFTLADLFVTGEGGDISPEVQKLALEYAALQYVHEAFQGVLKAQGVDPLPYAPGPVPVKK